jgi:AcrR family transcriptional regulator
MTSPRTTGTAPRSALTRARVLESAVALADRDGLGALTMRSLARELGIEAMSLYHHVANKEALADDAPRSAWKPAMRRQILTARAVLLRHPWASTVLESRKSFSLHVVRYYDSLIGLMRRGGFSYDLVHHAMHALGSRALGFSQELFEPDGATAGSAPGGGAKEGAEDAATAMLMQMAEQVPHMVEMLAAVSHGSADSTLGWCDDQSEFEFGLDIILDGLDQLAERERN